MAKHRRKNHEAAVYNNTDNNMNMSQNPFGIDPFQLINLFGGNVDMNSIGNMLSSMNTNGFNLGNLEHIANMAGINLNNLNNMNNLNGMMNNKSANNNSVDVKNNHLSQELNEGIEDMDISMDSGKKETRRRKTHNREEKVSENDENLIFLRHLQNYIHPEKKEFIDRIIKVYCEGKI